MLAIMSVRQLFVCTHCRRDNFRTRRGLQQHLATNRRCSILEKDKQEGVNPLQGKEHAGLGKEKAGLVDKEHAARRIGELLDEDECARAQIQGRLSCQDASRTRCGHQDEMDSVEEQEFQPPSLDDDEDSIGQEDDAQEQDESADEEDENELQVGGNQEGNDPALTGASDESLRSFKRYTELAINAFSDFTRQEEVAIELLYVLRKKRSSLDAYPEVMEWHLKATGYLHPNETLGDAKTEYLSRETIIAKLTERYAMRRKLAHPIKTILPSSRASVDIWCWSAQAQMESILTDPRWKDDDWLFFNDDPLPPPSRSGLH